MKTSQIIAKSIDTKWVVPRYGENAPNPKHFINGYPRQSSDLATARLVNGVKHKITGSYSDQYPSHRFEELEINAKAFGFLVTDGTMYWVVKPANFYGTLEEIEPQWVEQDQIIKAREAKQKADNAWNDQIRKDGRERAETSKQFLIKKIGSLMGSDFASMITIYTSTDDTYNEDHSRITRSLPKGSVSMSMDDLQCFVEKIAEIERARISA
jgi:hypothetical protein